jgi:hypothetical protein
MHDETARRGDVPDAQPPSRDASKVHPVAAIANGTEEMDSGGSVRPNIDRTNAEHPANERRTNAFVPTSTSTSINRSGSFSSPSLSPSPPLDPVNPDAPGLHGAGGVQRGALPASERGLSGPAWLEAFTAGISAVTGRPCTAGRMYLATLERIVTHHAPHRDAPSACAFVRDEAMAFARKWDGAHPPKGLTPDGLERWLNEGRQGPPEFGKRIVQLPADEWHEDDFSDLGAVVLR